MSTEKERGVLAGILADAYGKVFFNNWPAWLGGLLIGITSIVTFAWARPWGVVGGLREWFDWLFCAVGIYDAPAPEPPPLSGAAMLTFGLVWGAFISALLSRQFAVKKPPPFEVARSVAGGVMMGIGSGMAAGCNIGGFFSATSALSLGGPAMMLGLLVGSFLEVRYYYWELEHLRFKRGEGRPRRPRPGEFDWRRVQPFAGAALAVATLAVVYCYRFLGGGSGAYIETGGLLACGVAFGVIMHRSRFAFLQGFREPFISARAAQARGMAIAVVVSVIGFAVLKSTGLRGEDVYVFPTFWFGSLVGGIIFGFGMPFAGGCASGSCWRSAEGSLKLVVALFSMGVSNSLFQAWLTSSDTLSALMGRPVYLPRHLPYFWTVLAIVALMALYALVMSWNEKTRRFI